MEEPKRVRERAIKTFPTRSKELVVVVVVSTKDTKLDSAMNILSMSFDSIQP